jgi:glycosyltransferase involved in cell wall biosynthesis
VELGERLIELLSDASLRERLRARGREVAEQWRARHVADRLERFFADRRLTSTSG